ncbi:MAG: hypothetical protein ABIJ96_00695 [Elusimicrobiota bacterium]
MRTVLCCALLLTAAQPFPAAASDIYIGVERAKSPRWALGIDTFFPQDARLPADAETGRQLREIVRADLLFSRYFDLKEGGPAGGTTEAYREWTKLGAGFLLEAKVARVNDQIELTAVVRDLASGDAMLSRYYRQKADFWRTLAHRVADDVVGQLTGKKGIARSRIAFVNDQTGSKEVYLMDYDGFRTKRVTANNSINLMPRWTADGRRLAFTSYKDGNPDIFLLDLGRGIVRPIMNLQGLNLAGGFSPDGSRLAATLTQGSTPKAYFVDIRDGKSKRITSSSGLESSPTFSPDGEQIAYVTDRSGNPQIYSMEIATGRSRRLSRLNWCDSPAWSPTGEWIAFAGRVNPKDKFDIYLSDITGNRIVQLTHGEGSNEDPTWSPDGRFIAFSSTRGKRRRIFIMDRDGSAPHALGDMPSQSFTPSWGPAD